MPRIVQARLLDSMMWYWLYCTFKSCLLFHRVISVRDCLASLRCV